MQLGALQNFYENRTTTIVGVNKKTKSLVSLQRKDIHCWNRFISLFGKGPLAKIDFSLKKVNTHLLKHEAEIRELKDNYPDNTAYKAICIIANKFFIKKPEKKELFELVSTIRKFEVTLSPITLHSGNEIKTAQTLDSIELYENPEQNLTVLQNQLCAQSPTIVSNLFSKIREFFPNEKPEMTLLTGFGRKINVITQNGDTKESSQELHGMLDPERSLEVSIFRFAGMGCSNSFKLGTLSFKYEE